jgi:hypothetical protein
LYYEETGQMPELSDDPELPATDGASKQKPSWQGRVLDWMVLTRSFREKAGLF